MMRTDKALDLGILGLSITRRLAGNAAAVLVLLCLGQVAFSSSPQSSSERERSENIIAFIRESQLEPSHNFYWAALALQATDKGKITNAMDTELANREMVKFLLKHYNPGLFREGLRWLSDPLTDEYLQLLGAPLTGFDTYQKELAKKPLDSKRRTLISRAFAATKAKESAKQIYMLTVIAAGASESTMALGGLDLYAQLAYQQNEDKVQQDAYDRMAFVFRNIPDERLELLVFHLEDPVALWVLQMMRGALYSAIHITTQKVAQQEQSRPEGVELSVSADPAQGSSGGSTVTDLPATGSSSPSGSPGADLMD